jgi:hypothetical protein
MSQPPNPRYETLVRIVEKFCQEAPSELASLYRPDPIKYSDKAKQAKARAYCHLYLLVKFGLKSFLEREQLITDGSQDGGLDAYYIDRNAQKVYLIQFKYHHSSQAFEGDSVGATDLVKVEFDRILTGQKTDSLGKQFNSKVRGFQKQYQNAIDCKPVVVFLATIAVNEARLKKLVGDFPFDIFDAKRVYEDLIFKLCAGDYADPQKVVIDINKANKPNLALEQAIEIKSGRCDVKVVFAPTQEIGRVTAQYKNSILRYNPRNYLSLSHNSVNEQISDSIKKQKTNEFAILNNGITILADGAEINANTGDHTKARLTLTNPQIINGGQTAYTLGDIYENGKHHLFTGKEVMLKIVQLGSRPSNRASLIEAISNATNRQTKIDEADRRSNSKVFGAIQQRIFSNYGYFFEKKRGEFYDGLNAGFLSAADLIDRAKFLKAYLAFVGDPSSCRSKGEKTLFQHDFFKRLFPDSNVFVEALFAYRILNCVTKIEKKERSNRYGAAKYGNALRYGRFAVVAAVGTISTKLTGKENFDAIAQIKVWEVLAKWRVFEKRVKKRLLNKDYFAGGEEGFDNYYKGKTLNADIKSFSFR